MKRPAKQIIIFIFLISSGVVAFAQSVCIRITDINGNPVPIPLNRKDSICKNINTPLNSHNSRDTVTLSLPNSLPACSSPIPNASYRWRHKNSGTDYFTQSVITKDTGVWVGYIRDTIAMVEYKDSIHLNYYIPNGDITAMTPNGGNTCPLNLVTINLTSSGSFGSYQWYDRNVMTNIPTVIVGATSSSLSFTTKPKVVQVYGFDTHGCVADSFLSGYFDNTPTLAADIGPDLGPLCQGTSATFQNKPGGSTALPATADISYRYYRDGVLICSTTNQNGGNYNSCVIPLTTAGNVKIRFEISSAWYTCLNVDEVDINVTPTPVVDLPVDNAIVCFGESMDLVGTINLGTPQFNYVWSSVPVGFSSSTSNVNATTNTVTATPAVTTKYILSVTDNNNCGIGKDSIVLTSNPLISISSISNDTTICRYPLGATTVNLTATANGGVGPLTYGWAPNLPKYGISSPTIISTSVTPNIPDLDGNVDDQVIYTLTVTDANNCTKDRDVTIGLYAPLLGSIAEPIVVSETNPASLNVSIPANAGYNFTWDRWIDTLTTDTIYNIGTSAHNYMVSLGNSPSQYLEFKGPGSIYYEVEVKNNLPSSNPTSVCWNRDTIKVQYISDNTLLYVPNIFSPNAFNFENRSLKIYGDNLAADGFKLIVYNKWGNLMYETSDLSEAKTIGWDGGSKLEGVYTYVIVGKFKNGKDVTESPYNRGTFSLIK